MKENAPHVDVGSGSATDSMEPNNAGGGHLKPRLSTVPMVGLTFAILKFVFTDCLAGMKLTFKPKARG